ncbi:MAG: OmpA family protein [candidate division Zixibacteria bacterium]|nr:OmpA family protein [candidate division Zixibacteria bacterium]
MSEDNEKQSQPIIIVKKKSGHGGHHGGAWKVAYADFVTAMMAFFLVMWILSQSDNVKEAVQGYFQDPVGFMKSSGKGLMDGSSSPLKTRLKQQADVSSNVKDNLQALTQTAQKIRDAIDQMPEIGKLKDFVDVELIPEGLRIELAEVSTNPDSTNFFDMGSSRLKPISQLILTAISKELRLLPNRIVLEGHTDRTPFTSKTGMTNWELSADRANSARRYMENAGLRDGQVVEIRGYADKYLKFPDKPNDPRNRRIAIIVLHEELTQRYSLAE